MRNNPTVSIIIPTKNSAKTLGACLKSVASQTYKNLEIVVVDNGSADDTKEIARSHGANVYDIGPERSAQRNFGAAKATGEFLCFIDSDMELTPHVIEECVCGIGGDDADAENTKGSQNTKGSRDLKYLDGLVIPEKSFGIGFWAQCKAVEKRFYEQVAWIEAARFVRSDAFAKVGGYDESMVSGEDWDLSGRIANLANDGDQSSGETATIGRIKSYILHNEGEPSLLNILKKKYYYSKKIGIYIGKNSGQHSDSERARTAVVSQTSLLRRYALFLSKPQIAVENPIVWLGMVFVKTMEFVAGGIGYVISSMRSPGPLQVAGAEGGRHTIFISNGYSTNMSGGDVHSNRLINFLASRSARVSVILPVGAFEGAFDPQVNQLRYRSVPSESGLNSSNAALFFVYLYRIVASSHLINKHHGDVLICSSHLFHDTVPLIFKNRKAGSFCFVHHIVSEQNRKGLHGSITRALEKVSFWILKLKKTQIITVSERVREQLVNTYGFQGSRVHVSSNAIDVDAIVGARVHAADVAGLGFEHHFGLPGPEAKKYDHVFCGRLTESKGIFDLLAIVRELKKKREHVKCAVIGSGNDESRFKAQIKEMGLSSNIICFGYVSDFEKYEILKASKVFVLPSHEEGWGIVMAEALAAKLPVVAYDLQDITSIWGDAVSWVECFDTGKFAHAVERVLNDYPSYLEKARGDQVRVMAMDWNTVLAHEADMIENVAKAERETALRTKSKVLILGSYGRGNAGDDAFLLAAAELFKDFDIYINASEDSRLPQAVEKNVTKVSTDMFKDFFDKVRIFWVVKNVVYMGGDLWVELHENKFKRSSLWKMLILNLACFLCGKSVFYIGCGAGDLKGFSLFLARASARLAKALVVRDEHTKRLLNLGSVGERLQVLPDLAACLPVFKPEKKGGEVFAGNSELISEESKPAATHTFRVGVSMLYYVPEPEVNFSKVVDEMNKVFDYFCDADSKGCNKVEFVLLPFFKSKAAEHDDLWVNSLFSNKSNVTLETSNDVEHLVSTMKTLDAMIGFRLHANILGILAGTPCIGVAYRPKVRNFFESCNLGEFCVDMDQMNLLIPKILAIMDKYQETRDKVAQKSAALVAGARAYEEFVNTHIK